MLHYNREVNMDFICWPALRRTLQLGTLEVVKQHKNLNFI